MDYIEARGKEKVNRLGILLSKAGRTEDFLKSLSDSEQEIEDTVSFMVSLIRKINQNLEEG